MSTLTAARFPTELEQEIFEAAAELHGGRIPTFLLVARRVYEWLEPMLYRNIRVGMPWADAAADLERAEAFFDAVARGKPKAAALARGVHVVTIDQAGEETLARLCAVLPLCRNVSRLAILDTEHMPPGISAVFPHLSQMRLRRLSCTIVPEVVVRVEPGMDSRPAFAHLTHFDLCDDELTPMTVSFLVGLPSLTHLAICVKILDAPTLRLLLGRCRTLRFLVFLFDAGDPQPAEQNARTTALELDDPRVVVAGYRIWNECMLDDGYWATVEEFSRLRKLGNIPEKEFSTLTCTSVLNLRIACLQLGFQIRRVIDVTSLYQMQVFVASNNAAAGAIPTRFGASFNDPNIRWDSAELHPAVRMQNLRRLPPSLKNDAMAACRDDAPVDDVRRILGTVANESCGPANLATYLPLFYAIFDPARIPDPELVDTPEPLARHLKDNVHRAFYALDALARSTTLQHAPAAMPCMWARIWPWIAFISLYGQQIEGPTAIPESELLLMLFGVVARVLYPPPFRRHVVQTPGLLFVAGSAWRYLSSIHDVGRRSYLFASILLLLCEPDLSSRSDLIADLLAGTGGSFRTMARLYVQEIRNMDFNPAVDVNATMERRVGKRPGRTEFGPFILALLEEGYLGELIRATQRLVHSDSTHAQKHTFPTGALSVATLLLIVKPGYKFVAEAISAGLLDLLIHATLDGPGTGLSRLAMFDRLIKHLLPPLLSRRDVFDEMLRHRAGWMQLASFPAWDSFVSSVEARSAWYESRPPRKNACGNVKVRNP
ncbi:Carboxypeptidase [Mycena chlorophos]|uniref:Carboxypeptidase n=1 Tax=Mycena chlorophos TaxID=658473 RepID=A0A8H6SSU1_MYCCL|nr:Carboxypeptidase [Mycena chlorophos]